MVKATWEKCNGEYTDNIHMYAVRDRSYRSAVRKIEENANELALRLNRSIKICRGIHGCNAVDWLYDVLLHSDSVYRGGAIADKMRMLDPRRADRRLYIETFEYFVNRLNEFSHKIADHGFTLKSEGKIIGAGWSPYIDPFCLSDVGFANHLAVLLREIMDCVSPEFNDKYEVFVLPPEKTIYMPYKTVTIVFLKRGMR